MFPVVVSLHRLSRGQVGHHLPTPLTFLLISKQKNWVGKGCSVCLSSTVYSFLSRGEWGKVAETANCLRSK